MTTYRFQPSNPLQERSSSLVSSITPRNQCFIKQPTICQDHGESWYCDEGATRSCHNTAAHGVIVIVIVIFNQEPYDTKERVSVCCCVDTRTSDRHIFLPVAPFPLLIEDPEGTMVSSIQIHPVLSGPHYLITAQQHAAKMRRRRNIMTTPTDPAVAAPSVRRCPSHVLMDCRRRSLAAHTFCRAARGR